MDEIIQVCDLCLISDCNCNEKDNQNPKIVGYPPYHDGCMCYVVREVK